MTYVENTQGIIQGWLQVQIILKIYFIPLVCVVELNQLIENWI